MPQESLLDKFWGKPTPSTTRRRPAEPVETSPVQHQEVEAAVCGADDRARGKPAVETSFEGGFGADFDLDALD
jgi:hypothetical protein